MSTGAAPHARRRVLLANANGLHARPAALLAQAAQRFAAQVTLVLVSAPEGTGAEVGTRADAKQVLDLMFLGLATGSTVEIEAQGPDAETAVAAVGDLIQGGFGER